MNKTTRLKALLERPELAFLMEAHSGLSARIAEESGFEAIWASGLSISAAMGLPDRNEASWTQVIEVVEFMAENTSIPILLDGDTGYGNFNNAQRLVKKLCQRGIAGVCIEDKLFPKTNSFIGAGQDLASIEEFSGKIKAAKDAQDDPDFCVVARIEALISGCPMEEALRRADAYSAAGADALLIHSKKSDGAEILEFCKTWRGKTPVVVVPTKYYKTPTRAFRDVGISAVIWANHSLRASINAIRDVTRRIKSEESVAGIEPEVASLESVFELTREFDVQVREKRYLPA